ncbi:hypothetical protein ACLOJK_014192 [Asimina triloba]
MLPKTDMGVAQTPDSNQNSRDFEGIDGDSEGMIRSDYFTLGAPYAKVTEEKDREEGSVESDNPSWIDPGTKSELGSGGIALPRRNSGDFWSDSGSDRSFNQGFGDYDVKGELGYGDEGVRVVGLEGLVTAKKDSSEFWSDARKFRSFLGKGELGAGGIGIKCPNSGEFSSDWIGDGKVRSVDEEFEMGSGDFLKVSGGISELEGEERLDSRGFVEGEVGGLSAGTDNLVTFNGKSGEGPKKKVVWWKLPFELLKFCAFRVSPVWSISIAAAVIGFAIMGQRLYWLKRKARSMPLKLGVDDRVSVLPYQMLRVFVTDLVFVTAYYLLPFIFMECLAEDI